MEEFNNISNEDVRDVTMGIQDHLGTSSDQQVTDVLQALGIGSTIGDRAAKNIREENENKLSGYFATGPVEASGTKDRNWKIRAISKEKARALASRSMFYEASVLLQDEDEHWEIHDPGTKLLMVECYLQLGRENRANKCLRFIENFLTTKPHLSPNDLIELAKEFIGQSSYVRAMLILKVAAEIFLVSSGTPDEILSGVYLCYNNLDDIVTSMLKEGGRNRAVAGDMGMETMLDIYEKIRSIKNCSRSKQVVKEALCCRWLDYNYHLLGQQRMCIKYATRGIESMESYFTPTGAQRYRIYGSLLHNLAITLKGTQKLEAALSTFEKALEAKQNATDHEYDLLKKADVDETEKKLKELRLSMV